MKISNKMVVALVPAMVALAPVAAHADSVSFTGNSPVAWTDPQISSGVDQVSGANYTFYDLGGLNEFWEAAATQPDPTQQALFGTNVLSEATSFTFTVNSPDVSISQVTSFGQFFETYNSDSTFKSVWNTTLGADGKSITFTADSPADDLVAGERYGLSVRLLPNGTGTIPSDLDYTITWNGTAAVPEASTWAMMIAGLGIVGMGMRRKRQVALKAA